MLGWQLLSLIIFGPCTSVGCHFGSKVFSWCKSSVRSIRMFLSYRRSFLHHINKPDCLLQQTHIPARYSGRPLRPNGIHNPVGFGCPPSSVQCPHVLHRCHHTCLVALRHPSSVLMCYIAVITHVCSMWLKFPKHSFLHT